MGFTLLAIRCLGFFKFLIKKQFSKGVNGSQKHWKFPDPFENFRNCLIFYRIRLKISGFFFIFFTGSVSWDQDTFPSAGDTFPWWIRGRSDPYTYRICGFADPTHWGGGFSNTGFSPLGFSRVNNCVKCVSDFLFIPLQVYWLKYQVFLVIVFQYKNY